MTASRQKGSRLADAKPDDHVRFYEIFREAYVSAGKRDALVEGFLDGFSSPSELVTWTIDHDRMKRMEKLIDLDRMILTRAWQRVGQHLNKSLEHEGQRGKESSETIRSQDTKQSSLTK